MSKPPSAQCKPFVIGLTGNIATGKSTVAEMLARLGAEVIDADVVAHQVMRSGSSVWRQIVDHFGEGILKPDGEIDRAKLGAIVFADSKALRKLESLVHPAVIVEVNHRIAEIAGRAKRCESRPIVVVEAIKLIESGMAAMCDSLWVVTCPVEQQMERLRARRGLTESEARLRIQAQPPPSAKIALADVVIDNSGELDNTWRQVQREWCVVKSRMSKV